MRSRLLVPLAISDAAAALIAGRICAVTARHRRGLSLGVPGSPEVIYLSAPGQGLLPLHVVISGANLGQLLAQGPDPDGGLSLRFIVTGVRRFTVRIRPIAPGLDAGPARDGVAAISAWLCSRQGLNGLGESGAESLAAASRWRPLFGADGPRRTSTLRALVGRGRGATPAGDDFLVGALAHEWARSGAGGELAAGLAALAGELDGLTTPVSASYLRAAARGEFSSHLARLARQLPQGRRDRLLAQAGRIAAQGATSGLDTLTGFIAAARFSQTGEWPLSGPDLPSSPPE